MSVNEYINIPGNIRSQFLPFVLDPTSAICENSLKTGDVSGSSSNMRPQFFSFRPNQFYGDRNERGNFRVVPASFYDPARSLIQRDISYGLTYSPVDIFGNRAPSAGYNDNIASEIFEITPHVVVREYQQDSKLDQIMNIFQAGQSSWDSGVAAGEADAQNSSESKSLLQSIGDVLSKGTGTIKSAASAGKVIIKHLGSYLKDIFNITAPIEIKSDNFYSDFLLRIPHILYYQMMSTTTLNIYDFPYNGTVLYDSKGSSGYNARHLLNGYDGGSNSMLGVLLNFIGKNIKINTTPTWDGAQDDQGTQLEIEVFLFNDTLEAAIRNFILVNTIVPNNMWLQYHIFQHAPCIYDVSIDGVKRLYMCSGDFSYESIGQLRWPSNEFWSQIVQRHTIENVRAYIEAQVQSIRIPDMYKLRLSFTSLLPNNFNNYLFQYYGNTYIQPENYVGSDIHMNSVLQDITSNTTAAISKTFNYPDAVDKMLTKDSNASIVKAKISGTEGLANEQYYIDRTSTPS